MKGLRFKRGQSTVEYLVILSVVIAIVVILSTTLVKSRVSNIYNRAIRRIDHPTVITNNMLRFEYE